MTAYDAALHLANFVLPGLLLGFIAASLCKLLWLRSLKGVALWKLAAFAALAAVAASVIGLIATGRDGAMVTYAAMTVACAAALAIAGWRRG